MTIKVECEHCYAQLNLKDSSKIGKRIRCPKCKQPMTLTPMEAGGDDEFMDFEAEAEPLPSPGGKKKKGAGKGKSGKKGKGKSKKQESGSMLPLIIGGSVVALLLIGGLIFFLMSGGDDAPVADNAPAEVPAESATDEHGQSDAVAETDESKAADPATPAGGATGEDVAADESALPPNALNTEYLPSDAKLVVHLKPATLLQAPILKDVLEMEFAQQGLASFQDQYGFPLSQVEEISLGVELDYKELLKLAPVGGMPGETSFKPPSSDAEMAALEAGTADLSEMPAEGMSMEGMSGPGGMPQLPPTPKMSAVFRVTQDIDVAKVKFLQPGNSANMETPEDYPEASTSTEGSGEHSGAGEHGKSAPGSAAPAKAQQTYTVVMESGQVPGQPDLKVSFPNKRTMVFAEQKYLQQVLSAKGSKVCKSFTFVSQKSPFVLTGLLDFVPLLKKNLEEKGEEIPPGSEQFFALYDQGATAGFLVLDLEEKLTIRSGLAGKDEQATAAIQEQFVSFETKIRDDYAAKSNQIPQGFQAPLTETMESLKVVEATNTVQLEASFSAGFFQEIKTQLEGVGGQLAMAMAQNMMASQLGPGFSPGGGGMFPGGSGGMPGMPLDPTPTLNGEPTAATSATGLPEGYELLAAVDHVAEHPQGPTLQFVIDGDGAEVVQYKLLNVPTSAWNTGQPVKLANKTTQPHVSRSTWQPTQAYQWGDFGKTVQVIPVPVYAVDGATSLQQVQGEVTVQTAASVETVSVDLADEMSLASPSVEAAGIRILKADTDRGTAYYIQASEEGTTVVSVTIGGAAGVSIQGPNGGQYPTGDYPEGEPSMPEFPGNQRETPMSNPSADYIEEPGSPGANQEVQQAIQLLPSLGVSRPPFANPEGYVVVFDQSKTRTVSINVAHGVEEHLVAFDFSNLTVPPPVTPVALEPDDNENSIPASTPPSWTQVTDTVVLPEGFERIEATGAWRPYQDDNKRQSLDITLDLVGPAAERVMSILRYAVDECIAADDKAVVFAENDELLDDPTRMVRMERRAEAPMGTYRLTLPFNAVSPSFEALKTLEGEIRLQLASEESTLLIEDLDDYEGKRILHPVLSKERIILSLAVDEETKDLVLTLDDRSGTKVASLTLVDEQGLPRPDIQQTITVTEKGEEEFRFQVGEESIKSFGLRAVVFVGGKTVRVPFKFADMPLPPPPIED